MLGLAVIVSEEYAVLVLRPQTSPLASVVHVDRLLTVLVYTEPVLAPCAAKRLTWAVRRPDIWQNCQWRG